MACPGRFEPATYALEALKIMRNNSLDNGLSLAKPGMASAPRSVARSGIAWIRHGISRRLDRKLVG